MADVVIVADMVRGFCEKGHSLYCGQAVRKIIPAVRKLLETEATRGSVIIFVNDLHPKDDAEFKLFPPHCTEGSSDTEIITELADIKGEIIHKTRYSSFFNTKLDERLKEIKPGKIILCGVCTDICVYFTAADAWNHDYTVEVPVNCVASFDEKAHEFALKHMEKILAVKLTSI